MVPVLSAAGEDMPKVKFKSLIQCSVRSLELSPSAVFTSQVVFTAFTEVASSLKAGTKHLCHLHCKSFSAA